MSGFAITELGRLENGPVEVRREDDVDGCRRGIRSAMLGQIASCNQATGNQLSNARKEAGKEIGDG